MIETVRRISALDIDVRKVEFPVDAGWDSDRRAWREVCQALTEACRTPSVLLSAVVGFETFADQVEIACQAGASGFMAGRAIWSEVAGLQGSSQQTFLRKVAKPHFEELSRRALRSAKPWSAASSVSLRMPPDGWYAQYGDLA